MNKKIKEYADKNEIKSLKYIFADALDVDPTFANYEEEYNYCKAKGLLETHIDLTPFRSDATHWDAEYWTMLKMDLKSNFSDARMTHMREVAQVYLAEKVSRLLEEREKARKVEEARKHKEIPRVGEILKDTEPCRNEEIRKENERRRIDEANVQKVIDLITKIGVVSYTPACNERIEAAKTAYKSLTPSQQASIPKQYYDMFTNAISSYAKLSRDEKTARETIIRTKKVLGVAVAAIAVAIIVLIVILK